MLVAGELTGQANRGPTDLVALIGLEDAALGFSRRKRRLMGSKEKRGADFGDLWSEDEGRYEGRKLRHILLSCFGHYSIHNMAVTCTLEHSKVNGDQIRRQVNRGDNGEVRKTWRRNNCRTVSVNADL